MYPKTLRPLRKHNATSGSRMIRHAPLLLCLCLFLLTTPAHSAQYRVVAVSDGDTITVEPRHGGDRVKVRLYGIDAPELDQPHGTAARLFVVNKARFKRVDVRPVQQDKDSYGRIVAVVEIPGVGVLQEILLKAGLAWVNPHYCMDCGAWKAMQSEARARRRGLWARKDIEGKAVPPWEWRKGKRLE